MSDTSQLNSISSMVVNMLLIPLIPLLTAYLSSLIKKKVLEMEGRVKNEEFLKYINMAEDAVLTSVAAINQVYVDSIMKTNGTLSDQEQKTAFNMAKEKTFKIMGNPALKGLESVYSDVGAWLESRIEYYVKHMKFQPPSTKNISVIGDDKDENNN